MGLRRKDVGAVIVTHNSGATVQAALASVTGLGLAGVCVVDNGSRDGTPDLVEGLVLDEVRLLRGANVGFGAGCNAGVLALGERPSAYLLLNPDAQLALADLDLLVAHLNNHPACGVVGPVLYSSGQALTSAGGLARLRTELRYVVPAGIARLLPDRRAVVATRSGPVDVVEGACMLVRRSALAAVGGFDERFFLFFEEHDLSRGLRRHGLEAHLCVEAHAQHALGVSRATKPFGARPDYFTSTVRYLRKWEGPIAAGALTAVACGWWAIAPLLGRLPRAEARALRRGLLRGWTWPTSGAGA